MGFVFNENIIYSKDPTATSKRIKQYKEYYKVKYEICKAIKPKIIAEIGVRAGYSAWSFLQAAPDAEYYGFDANNGKHGGQGGKDGSFFRWAKKILSPYDCQFFEIDTQKTNDLKVRNVDLFHVDGDHSVKGVQHDLDLAFISISEHGTILVDDIVYLKEVRVGVNRWLKKMDKFVIHGFVESLRGEMLITRR